MLMRYAVLLGAAAISVYGTSSVSAGSADMVLVDAGHAGGAASLTAWVAALIAVAMLLSDGRGASSGLPPVLDAWTRANKTWLLMGAGLLVGAAFYLI